MKGKLTPKQQRFVEEYLVDLNATRAYRAAGYRGSDNVCAAEGHKLLRNPKIAAAIAEAQQARSERTRVDADWVLQRLSEEADADIGDLYDDAGNLKPLKEWPAVWRKGLIAGIETVSEKTGKGKDARLTGKVVKIRLADRSRIKELLGKHVYVSAFREKIDHSSSDGSMSPPSLADFYGGMKKARNG